MTESIIMSRTSQKRLQKDIIDIIRSPLSDNGIFYAHDENNMLQGYAIIFGPSDTIYRYGANEYHETYLSWKSIIWLQNILEKKKIPYMFTLADNSLFYQNLYNHKDQDNFMRALHNEIDLTKWFFFGDRCMGFNQWASLEEYPRGTTHPLDKAHVDAVKLMKPTFEKLIGGK